jgi:hypothetical protein
VGILRQSTERHVFRFFGVFRNEGNRSFLKAPKDEVRRNPVANHFKTKP